ncbi:hypothetical protein [Acetivibrio cellulolyticus]|uniref:hypothetical protein n=1 Tax=Acetivibrio cellulolyticus TaxID=35830 RepID=UPI0001E2E696|nr:hypothetical protein [Acetivibrio cellulolyticus]
MVDNFFWDKDNKCVCWSNNGKDIKVNVENMYFACLEMQKKYIFVEVGKNYSQDQIYYFSFDGNKIFTVDKVTGSVSWQSKDEVVNVQCDNLVSAQFYIEHELVLVITSNKQNERLLGFALNGKKLFEKGPPQDYNFRYLSTSANFPSVVCDGGKTNADAYGRSNWHFVINTLTGDMTKCSLAY